MNRSLYPSTEATTTLTGTVQAQTEINQSFRIDGRLIERSREIVAAGGTTEDLSLPSVKEAVRGDVKLRADFPKSNKSYEPTTTPALPELSLRYTWAGVPALVVVCGLSGTGKSALADTLSRRVRRASVAIAAPIE